MLSEVEAPPRVKPPLQRASCGACDDYKCKVRSVSFSFRSLKEHLGGTERVLSVLSLLSLKAILCLPPAARGEGGRKLSL